MSAPSPRWRPNPSTASRSWLAWLLDHTLLMGRRLEPLLPREIVTCLLASELTATLAGLALGCAATLVAGQPHHWFLFTIRALALSWCFAFLFLVTGGLAGVYLIPRTLAWPRWGGAARAALFFLSGVVSMAAGLPLYTPITHLPLQPGIAPLLVFANGLLVAALGLTLVRFHQLEAEQARAVEARRQQELREQELLQLALQAEVQALQAQIQPHFLFNTLNSIAALVEGGGTTALAQAALEQLAGLFRYTHGASRRPSVPLREEWEFCRLYLELEKLRLGDRLRVQAQLDEAVADWPIPGLLLQPLVENCIVHAIARAPLGGLLNLRAESFSTPAGDGCRILVRDEVTALAAAAVAGMGAAHANIRRRLELAYPERHHFRFRVWPEENALTDAAGTTSGSEALIELFPDRTVAERRPLSAPAAAAPGLWWSDGA